MLAINSIDDLTRSYISRAPTSARLHSRATHVHPGGDTRSVLFVEPFPIYMQSRSGAEVIDVDGNVYIDALNNFTALLHGGRTDHLNRPAEQMLRGVAFGSPTSFALELGELLVSRIESIETIRFCNSGTEAVMHTIRAARAFTNRSKILMFRGGYHGSYDATALLDTDPSVDPRTGSVLDIAGSGIPSSIAGDVLIAPYNDLDAATEIAERAGDDLAAILVEPLQNAAGCIPGQRDFLSGLLELARDLGALSIFDEVVTLRLARGGLQDTLSLVPDLTALGKIIGGGFPIGAFGGAGNVMETYSPIHGRLKQSGTFNAFPLSMSAGLAAMQAYDQSEIERLNALGERLSKGLMRLADRFTDPPAITGRGSLMNVSWPSGAAQGAFYKASMINGLQIAPRGMLALSTAMDESVTEEILSKADRAMELVEATALERP